MVILKNRSTASASTRSAVPTILLLTALSGHVVVQSFLPQPQLIVRAVRNHNSNGDTIGSGASAAFMPNLRSSYLLSPTALKMSDTATGIDNAIADLEEVK